ncbi:hypothetical protein cypCar_00003561 [Cyprinus carpio]|nr:hypothetical protein cypCar_00003561 [Cyprinus carpio]
MASEGSTEQLPGVAAGSEVKPDAVESCLLDATEASENEPSRQNSLIESQKVEQEEVEMLPEEMEEDLDLKQQSGVEQENGPEKSSVTDQNKEEENCAQEHSEQKNSGEEEKNEVRNIAKDAAQCSEELVIAKVEDFNSEMAVDVDKAEGRDGRMEVDGSDDAGKPFPEPIKREKTEPPVVQTQPVLKTEVKPQVAQLSDAVPVQVKDEPMDEEYEKASVSLRPVGNIKDEPDTAAEFSQIPDSIKISAVFSVGGNTTSIVPAAAPAKVAPVPTLSLPSLAPANPIGVVCTGCNKVLLKGQTAFQRKGCPKLYCSPQCLCTTSNVMVKMPQKKQCHHCHKDILDLKDVINAPVDMSGTVKEFCSQTCLSALSFKCSVCHKTGMAHYLCVRRELALSVKRRNEENDIDQMPVAKKARKSKQPAMTWKTETEVDLVPQTLRFLPAREPGPQLWSADSYTPLSLFKLFFTENAVSTLCYNTNAQAARSLARGRKYKWTDVSVSEMYRYFGLIFYMGMVKLISIKDYWRQGSLFSVPFPATIMSRDRYRTISWNMHMSNPAEDKENDKKKGTNEYDRLFRVKPLMDTIRLACKTIYHPRRNLAVDERMVACKASTGMTQYMKAKPTKWGFKLFVLADSSNGYTVDFSVYTGKNKAATGNGLPYDTVMSLLDKKVLGSGYHVYMDNFYTSPKLLSDMLEMKYGACGTYRDYRKNSPQNASNSLTKNSPRGSIRWIRNGPLVFVKWMDTRETYTHEVNLMGSIHKLCSNSCFNQFRSSNKLNMNSCVNCGGYCYGTDSQCPSLQIEGSVMKFCKQNCVVAFKKESFSKMKPVMPINTVTSTSNNTPTPKPRAPKPAPSESSSSVKTSTSSGPAQTATKIPCSQCLKSFYHRPELLEFKRKMYAFCNNSCVEEFKQINNVMARCEYCKIDKVVKEVKRINKIDRSFCSEGCKLLYKHDLVKRWGKKHCRNCFYCSGSAQALVTEVIDNVEQEFCGNICLSQHSLLMRKEIKCSMCRQAKKMTETVKWLGEIKHFCSLQCLMFFCSLQGTTGAVRPANKTLSTQGTSPAPSPGPQTTVNHTPLVTKEATPVIASVISLSSASNGQPGVLGSSVLQASVPAATAKSSGITASTQTDGAKVSAPAPRILKNKALLCKPLSQNKGTSCKPNVCDMNTQTDGPSVIVLPVPVPVYIPLPMNLYTQYTPKSVGLPLPVPVPLFFPTTLDSAERIVKTIQEIKEKIPDDPLEADLIMMAEMVAEDAEKEKSIIVTDQTSNIMDDLDLEALSSNLSWEEDSVSSAQTWDQTPEPERPPPSRSATLTPVPTAAEEPQMDLEADFPIESIELFREPTQTETTDSGKRRSRKRKHDGFPQKKKAVSPTCAFVSVELSSLQVSSSGQQGQNVVEDFNPELAKRDCMIEGLKRELRHCKEVYDITKAALGDLKDTHKGLIEAHKSVVLQLREVQVTTQTLRSELDSAQSLVVDSKSEDAVAQSSDVDSQQIEPCCHPDLEIRPPSDKQLEFLFKQSRRRPDRYGCLLFRAVLPQRKYMEWASNTNWDARSMTLKEDLLKCCTAEISYGLCKFISEVRRPNGEKYSPDSIFYLCLGIQKYLFENNRMENIFADVFYTKFCHELTNILRQWKPTILPSGYVHSRVEEEYLWDCKQLGAFSPGVLLNTLLYFFTKYFSYKTVEQHRRLSFGHMVRCSRSKGNTKVACLRFYPPKEDTSTVGIPAKKRKEEEEENDTVYEIKENADNPLRCPVRLYEFYLSKCSPSVRQRTTDFYLSPERSCVPNSPMWFSTTSLSDEVLDSMLTRILTVRELHLERDKSPNETDSDSDSDIRP